MKKDIHPENNRIVLFRDDSTGDEFLIPSTVVTEETGKAKEDGKEYPLYELEISSASHPFYTGQEKVVDTAGRIDKFKARREIAEKAKGKTKKKKETSKKEESNKKETTTLEDLKEGIEGEK